MTMIDNLCRYTAVVHAATIAIPNKQIKIFEISYI